MHHFIQETAHKQIEMFKVINFLYNQTRYRSADMRAQYATMRDALRKST